MMLSTALLVDGTGIAVRCNRAGRDKALSANGERTGPLLMFINSLARQIRDHRPSHVLVAWDGKLSLRWRQERYPGYKRNRAAPPEHGDIELMMEFCRAARIRYLALTGFEADDVIAWAARGAQAARLFRRIIIASDDADLHQLLSPCVYQAPLAAGASLITPGWLKSHYPSEPGRPSVQPAQLPMLRAIAGDESDGIPGVGGYGLTKACRLLHATNWAWPPALPDEKDVKAAAVFREILDLSGSPERVSQHLGPQPPRFATAARFDRSRHGELPVFLQKYQMSSVLNRLEKGSLW